MPKTRWFFTDPTCCAQPPLALGDLGPKSPPGSAVGYGCLTLGVGPPPTLYFAFFGSTSALFGGGHFGQNLGHRSGLPISENLAYAYVLQLRQSKGCFLDLGGLGQISAPKMRRGNCCLARGGSDFAPPGPDVFQNGEGYAQNPMVFH